MDFNSSRPWANEAPGQEMLKPIINPQPCVRVVAVSCVCGCVWVCVSVTTIHR